MDIKSIIIDEEQKAQDEILKAILSDKLFNEFDPAFWASASGHVFAEKAFPILAKYHLGKELAFASLQDVQKLIDIVRSRVLRC